VGIAQHRLAGYRPGTRDTLLAHGVGGRQDLPIPAELAYLAAGAALVVSAVVLALAWRTSRFHGDASGRPLWAWLARIVDSPVVRGALVVFVLLLTAWVSMAAIFGRDTLVNPAFRAVYVVLWVGLVPAALLLGPVYRLCNPLRWLHRAICRVASIDPAKGILDASRLGLWPAALLLFSFVWLELADSALAQDLSVVRLWFALLALVLVAGAMLCGESWFASADPFEVYSSIVARLSPFARRSDGVLVVRNPLENLDTLPPDRGLVAVVSVLFGSTAFDSFKELPRWLGWAQQRPEYSTVLNSAALLAFCLIVFVSFTAACLLTARLGKVTTSFFPNRLAHSVVPIVIGYVVAHYLSFFVSEFVAFVQVLGDPLSRGWNVTSWAAGINRYAIYDHPTALAVVKVLAVVVGHVLGVVAAHDRSVRLLPPARAITAQFSLLVLMVAYTVTGLWLLLST
jgi:hypothetical protein